MLSHSPMNLLATQTSSCTLSIWSLGPSYLTSPATGCHTAVEFCLIKLCKGMLLQDVIEPACSPHNAPLLLIPKKQGDWHVVVDFRKLNTSTIPDHYPMPRLGELLQSLGDLSTVFSTFTSRILSSWTLGIFMAIHCLHYLLWPVHVQTDGSRST